MRREKERMRGDEGRKIDFPGMHLPSARATEEATRGASSHSHIHTRCRRRRRRQCCALRPSAAAAASGVRFEEPRSAMKGKGTLLPCSTGTERERTRGRGTERKRERDTEEVPANRPFAHQSVWRESAIREQIGEQAQESRDRRSRRAQASTGKQQQQQRRASKQASADR